MDKEAGNKTGIAITLGSIGSIYMYSSDYRKSLEYYQNALQIAEELGNKVVQATNLSNMGVIYEDEASSGGTHSHIDSLKSKAVDCFQKALKLEEEFGR